MRRDLELVRRILLAAEEQPTTGRLEPLQLDGITPEEVFYHVRLLRDAGLVKAEFTMGPNSHIAGITWAGHDYLDAVRDPRVWQAVKDKISAAGLSALSVPFEVVKELGAAYIKQRLGLG